MRYMSLSNRVMAILGQFTQIEIYSAKAFHRLMV
jgi:DNA-binding transcriptional regulator/RsmH inhibitor MraZ